MRKLFADLVAETTATAGTGTLTLAQLAGFARFSDRFSINDLVYYAIRNGANWEVGKGTVGAANTLARTTPLFTLVAGVADATTPAAITLAGSSIVRCVVPEHLFAQLTKEELALVAISTVMVEGFTYGVQANSLTMTLPASPQVNDRVGLFQAAASITGTIVDPNGAKINNTVGNMTIDITEFAMSFLYVSAAYGWKVMT